MLLFFRGELSAMKLQGIALIGGRSCSLAVQRACHYLAAEFARICFCIISGMAMGCDTSTHRGALKAGGRTVALVGHGRDTVYPPQNRRLAHAIVLNGGLLLSEYDLGALVSRHTLGGLRSPSGRSCSCQCGHSNRSNRRHHACGNEQCELRQAAFCRQVLR